MAANVTVTGAIGTIVVTNGITEGTWIVSGTENVLSVGSVAAGVSMTFGGALKTLASNGDFSGDVGAAGGMLAVVIKGSLTGAHILAGANFGADGKIGGSDDTFNAATLRTVVVIGTTTASLITAGLNPVDRAFLNGDDQFFSGSAIKAAVFRKAVDSSSAVLAASLPKVAVLAGKPVLTAKTGTFVPPAHAADSNATTATCARAVMKVPAPKKSWRH